MAAAVKSAYQEDEGKSEGKKVNEEASHAVRMMSTTTLEANIENKMLGLKKIGEKPQMPVAQPQRL